MPRYWLFVRKNGVVGPHDLKAIREWVTRKVVGEDWIARREDGENWVPIREILVEGKLPKLLQSQVERDAHWNSLNHNPASEKQLFKLRYFGIPFSEDGLLVRRASEILHCFAQIDPITEAAYMARPATEDDVSKLRALGGRPRKPLTHSEAQQRIEERFQTAMILGG